jgi:hypothetical protein
MSIILAFIPSMDVDDKALYVIEIVAGTLVAAICGVLLYKRGERVKASGDLAIG